MIKIMKDCWNKNSDKLREVLAEKVKNGEFDYTPEYTDLVKLTFDTIYESTYDGLDTSNITEVDDGDYQGTILFLIPFDTYQPSEYEYLMTYIGYGSCSYCDALQYACYVDGVDERAETLLSICKDIVCNTIHPYNHGWRQSDEYEQVEMDE